MQLFFIIIFLFNCLSSVCAQPASTEWLKTLIRNAEQQGDSFGILVKPILLPYPPLTPFGEQEQTLFSYGSDKPLNPASVIKLLTTYVAMEYLGPSYRWKTEIRIRGKLQNGVLDGDLILKSNFDPKFIIEDLNSLLIQVKEQGLHTIKGNLILDSSHGIIPDTEASIDPELNRPYNVSPFENLMNFKAVEIQVSPRSAEEKTKGIDHPKLELSPNLEGITIDNRIHLSPGPCKGLSDMKLYSFDNPIEKTQQIKDILQQSNQKTSVLNSRPLLLFLGSYSVHCGESSFFRSVFSHKTFVDALFRGAWKNVGGLFYGKTYLGRNVSHGMPWFTWNSPHTLLDVVQDIHKFSNNVMARQLSLQLINSKTIIDLSELDSIVFIIKFLNEKGFDTNELKLTNSAGLSRKTRITANTLVSLLQKISSQPYANVWRTSLPLLGVDGTLQNRLKNSDISGKAWIKTGSLDQVKALGGYLQASSGKMYALAWIVNGHHADQHEDLSDIFLKWIYENG